MRLIPYVVLSLLLAGCTEDISTLRSELDGLKERAAPPLPQIPTMRPPETYRYLSSGLRDPFRTGESETVDTGTEVRDCPIKPDSDRVPEQLEQFPLDSLDMVGTLAQGDSFFGLLKDPNGVVHKVVPGNFAGSNSGRITAVRDDGVDVSELYADGNGCFDVRESEITLDDSSL